MHDFVLDPSFCNWVLGREDDDTLYWQAYKTENPDKVEQIEQAKALVLAMVSQDNKTLLPAEKAVVWGEIQHRISTSESSEIETSALVRKINPIWSKALRLAASFVGIIMLSVAIYYMVVKEQGETVQYATIYGQVKRVLLPDGSEVILNANSTLSFKKPWNSESTREVELKGEAFFKVSRQANNQKFKVKLQDNVSIEVLGTQFTATQRSHVSRVVLKEGKVNFSITNDILHGLFTETIKQETLKPGELAAWNGQSGSQAEIEKRTPAHLEVFEAFQHNKLMFADASLMEVARVLEDVYGFEVTFSNNDLMKRRYTGSVPHDKVEVLFIALEKLFDLEIIQAGNQLEIKKALM